MADLNDIRKFLPENAVHGRAAKKLYNITITTGQSPGGWTVTGQMKTPFKFELAAEWSDLINGSIPGTELLKKFGNAELSTGIMSQKYFNKGCHFKLNAEFRIVESGTLGGKNQIITAAKDLGNMMCAKANSYDSLASLADKFQSAWNDGKKETKKALKGELSAKSVFDKMSRGVQAQAVKAMNNRTATVQFGTHFECTGMIIEGLNVEYSKELVANGPMYGDFSVSMSSIQAIHKGTGRFGINQILKDQNTQSRINFS